MTKEKEVVEVVEPVLIPDVEIVENRQDLLRTLNDIYFRHIGENPTIDLFRYEVIYKMREGKGRLDYVAFSSDAPDKISYASKPQHIYDSTKRYKTMGSMYTELYAINPDKVRMVIYRNKARALLWTCDDGTVVLDRIYPNDGAHVGVMQKWARDCNFVYRIYTSLPEGFVTLSDDKYHLVTLQYNKFFPYSDTFRYGWWRDDKHIELCNRYEIEKDGSWIFTEVTLGNTNGRAYRAEDDEEHEDEEDMYHCEACGNSIYSGDTRWFHDECYCEYCWSERYFYCDRCDHAEDREYASWVQAVFVNWRGERREYRWQSEQYWCEDCVVNYAVQCHECSDLIDQMDAYQREDNPDDNYCLTCWQEMEQEREETTHEETEEYFPIQNVKEDDIEEA